MYYAQTEDRPRIYLHHLLGQGSDCVKETAQKCSQPLSLCNMGYVKGYEKIAIFNQYVALPQK